MLMILLLHISIALASLGFTVILFATPSRNKLYAQYGLIAATIASGTWLVISTHAAILQSCMTGLIYVSLVAAGTTAARRRLARQEEVTR